MPAQRDLPVATELLRTRISIWCGSASCSSEATRAVLSADTNVATDIAPAAAPVEHPPPNQLVTELVPCACRLSVGQGCAALAEVPIHASAERRRRALCATCLEHVGSEVCSCECGSCLQPDINYEADEDEINNIDIHELGFRMASSADEVEDSIERALAERAALLPPATAQALRATPFRTAILPQNHATRSPTAVYDLRDPKTPPSPPASPPERDVAAVFAAAAAARVAATVAAAVRPATARPVAARSPGFASQRYHSTGQLAGFANAHRGWKGPSKRQREVCNTADASILWWAVARQAAAPLNVAQEPPDGREGEGGRGALW